MVDLGRDLLEQHYPTVRDVVRRVARTYRLTSADQDDLLSSVHLKLVERDYEVLRRFEGRSSVTSYLTTVVTRLHLDQRTAAWGKWRPSVQARRHGAVGIRLERLVGRDGLALEPAIMVIRSDRRVTETAKELEALALTFPHRQRPRVFAHADMDSIPDTHVPCVMPDVAFNDEAEADHVRTVLVRAVASLPVGDRSLLRLRYQEGRTIAWIAKKLEIAPRRAYSEFERVHRHLRMHISDNLTWPSTSRPRCRRATNVLGRPTRQTHAAG